jgi:Double zinc ribbon/Adenylate and Guanylate cyclase catalytic domain
MRCPKCSAENPEGAKVCLGCVSLMAAKCPRCGADNKPRAKFCNDCGAPLNASTPGAAAVESRPDIKQDAKDDIAGERRHLTVLFSISLDRPRSPAISIRSSGAKSSASTIARRRTQSNVSAGMSRSTLGDGVIAYFGYPQGLDDDAERAARAGLAILAAITRLNDHPARPKLAARVGIDSGTVVVGAGAAKTAMYSATRPISPLECRRLRNQAPW